MGMVPALPSPAFLCAPALAMGMFFSTSQHQTFDGNDEFIHNAGVGVVTERKMVVPRDEGSTRQPVLHHVFWIPQQHFVASPILKDIVWAGLFYCEQIQETICHNTL